MLGFIAFSPTYRTTRLNLNDMFPIVEHFDVLLVSAIISQNENKYMRLVGKDMLCPLRKQNEILDRWLSAWIHELGHARWWSPADVLNQFPKAQEHGDGLFLFQTDPKGYYIEVKIVFPQGIALITALTGRKEDNNE